MENINAQQRISTKKMLLIFIGELFLAVSLRIFADPTFNEGAFISLTDGFDILPNFIGYILIFFGVSSMVKYDKAFFYSKILTAILIVVSLGDFYQINVLFEKSNLIRVLSLSFMAIQLALELLRIFFFFRGVDNMVNKCNVHTLLDKPNRYFSFFAIIAVADYGCLLGTAFNGAFFSIEFLFALGLIVARVLVASFVLKAKGDLNNLDWE